MTEGQSSGVLLGTLHAKDPDEGENGTVFYSVSGTVPEGSKMMLKFVLYVCKCVLAQQSGTKVLFMLRIMTPNQINIYKCIATIFIFYGSG